MAGRALTNLFDRDTMVKPSGSNGTAQGGYENGYQAQGGFQNQPPVAYPPEPQPHATHAAPQPGGWSNGTTPENGNWQGQ